MEKHTNLSKLALDTLENDSLEQIKGGASNTTRGVSLRSNQDDKRRERPGGIQTQVRGRSLWGREDE